MEAALEGWIVDGGVVDGGKGLDSAGAVVVDDRGREIVGARARRASPRARTKLIIGSSSSESESSPRGAGDARAGGGAATSASMPRMNASRGSSSSSAIVRSRMEGSGGGGKGGARARVRTRWALSSAWRARVVVGSRGWSPSWQYSHLDALGRVPRNHELLLQVQ